MGVVQSGTASRPATTVPPQDYMYKSHRFLWSSGVGELHHCVIWLPSNSSIGLPRRRCTRNCERMAAPGAWKADADTSGATSPPPSSWVRHAGIGNWIISDAMRESVSHLLQTAIR